MNYKQQLKDEEQIVSLMKSAAEESEDALGELLAMVWEKSNDIQRTYLWIAYPQFKRAQKSYEQND